MITALPTPYPSFIEQKMEYVLSNENFKANLWKEITPISMGKSGVVNFKQIKDYTNQFFEELNTKSHHLTNIKTFSLISNFIQASAEVLKYNPEVSSVEITSAKSIFIFTNREGIKVFLELFFDSETRNFSEAVINIYRNKEQELAVNGTLNFVIQKLDNYFNPAIINLYNTTETPYAISGSFATSFGV